MTTKWGVMSKSLEKDEKHFDREYSDQPLCCSCEHRYGNGFWFERAFRLADKSGVRPELAKWLPDEERGWIGYTARRPSFEAIYVCLDCALYECDIEWSNPPGLWSPDLNELDGEEPRLSRILRQYSGLGREVSV